MKALGSSRQRLLISPGASFQRTSSESWMYTSAHLCHHGTTLSLEVDRVIETADSS